MKLQNTGLFHFLKSGERDEFPGIAAGGWYLGQRCFFVRVRNFWRLSSSALRRFMGLFPRQCDTRVRGLGDALACILGFSNSHHRDGVQALPLRAGVSGASGR